MKLDVDYSLSLTARIDTAAGTVEYVAANLDVFRESEPESVFNPYPDRQDVPEYLPLEHPQARAAIALAERIEILGGHVGREEVALRVRLRPQED